MSFRNAEFNVPDLSWLRSVIDLTACFIMAVVLLRGFILEGYLISTGSMAPGLLGFHKRTVCPSCGFPFAFGISFDESVEPSEWTAVTADGTQKYATCPNCGQIDIDVSRIPVSHGDQLLVQKHLFDFRSPRRWETVVFRNPASPEEAYVKRVAGLSGEQIQVIDGDIRIDGTLARKDYRTQCEMRIPVADLGHLSDASDWEMPWDWDTDWKILNGTPESLHAATVRFRPWRWYGGGQFVETPLSPEDARKDWDEFQRRFSQLPISLASRIDYDETRQVLRCEGVMSADLQRHLIANASGEAFRNAVYRLAALSHLCTVTDRYGYNAMVASREYPVRDLMLCVDLSWSSAPEHVMVQVPRDSAVWQVVLFPQTGRIAVYSAGNLDSRDGRDFSDDDVQMESTWDSAKSFDQDVRLRLEVSNFDGQLLVAVNETACLLADISADGSPAVSADSGVVSDLGAGLTAAGPAVDTLLLHAAGAPSGTADGLNEDPGQKALRSAILREQQQRWQLSVPEAGVRIHALRMFRDVYYTPGKQRNAVRAPFKVPDGQYFVLGDNSPVSSDSRNWADPGVPHNMLLGKPFLVHLPSRPAVLEFADRRWPMRIPDWSRIRYIH